MSRVDKVAQALKKEVSNIIHDELRDRRLGFITVMRVELSKDLSVAKIFYSVMGSKDQKEKACEGLESASKFIRRLIAEKLKLRITPELIFRLDESIDYSLDIVEKIERINNELKKNS